MDVEIETPVDELEALDPEEDGLGDGPDSFKCSELGR